MSERMAKSIARRGAALCMVVMLLCAYGLAVAEDVTTPTDMSTPVPVVYTVSVFVQNGADASSFTWVGQLPLSFGGGVPTLSLEQLSALLAEKGHTVDLNAVTFEYGTGSEMRLSNWLGSTRRGDESAVALRRAPVETELFVLIVPIVSADEEEEIIIEEDTIDLVGVPSAGEKPTEVRDTRAVAVTVRLPYTVTIEVVNPQDVYYYGDAFTLKAVLHGTVAEPVYQWEVLPYGASEWQLVEGATEETYTFILNEENSLYDIRVTVYDAAEQ